MEYINRLDIQLVNSCNLTCAGCISLSDFPRKGFYLLNTLADDCKNWATVLQPKVITLFGGEPLMHPDILECIKIIRDAWPDCIIRLITNGLHLYKFDPTVWYKYDNFEMQVSFHRKQDRTNLKQYIKNILILDDWKINKNKKQARHIFMSFTNKNKYFKIFCSHFKHFNQPYNIQNGKIVPYNSNPNKAHSICGSPNTPVLINGKIYKCPPVANLIDLLGQWNNYHGLAYNDNLTDFVANINKPETVCSGCPENAELGYDHFDMKNILIKKRKLL